MCLITRGFTNTNLITRGFGKLCDVIDWAKREYAKLKSIVACVVKLESKICR